MAMPADNVIVASLGWRQLAERSWQELVAAGLPTELADLGQDLAERTGRRVLVYTMPIRQAGVCGLAVPFVDEDGVVLDPSLLREPDELAGTLAHELAHILYPGWGDLREDQHEEMEGFARALGPSLLARLPRHVKAIQPVVDATLEQCRRSVRGQRARTTSA